MLLKSEDQYYKCLSSTASPTLITRYLVKYTHENDINNDLNQKRTLSASTIMIYSVQRGNWQELNHRYPTLPLLFMIMFTVSALNTGMPGREDGEGMPSRKKFLGSPPSKY